MVDVQLHLGDCLEILPTLEAGGVDAVVTDPPYGTTACKWDTALPLEPMWMELERTSRKNAAIVLFCSQPFASALVMSRPTLFKWEDIWHKSQAVGHLNAWIMPLREHENLLIFGNGRITYNPQFTVKPTNNVRPDTGRTKLSSCYGVHGLEACRTIADNQSFPRSVISFNNVNRGEYVGHPTQKPIALMEYLIKTYSDEGDTVLDFTMGSGTTGVACVKTGRNFIGIEIDEGYFKIAEKRIAEAQMQPRLEGLT